MGKRRYGWPITLGLLLHAPSYARSFMDIDEGSYAAIACRLLQGGEPYRDGVENKFPLIFYLYKWVFALFGRYNMHAMHVVCALSAIATALVCGEIARRFEPRASFWAATFYVIFSAAYYPKMQAANTEMFAVLPAALAVWAYLAARQRPALYFVAGLFGGVAVLFKQVAAATIAALMADRAWEEVRSGATGQRRLLVALRDLTLMLLGLGAVLGAMAAYLRAIGVWDDALFWSLTYAFRHYMPAGTHSHGFVHNLFTSLLPFLLTVSPLILLGWRARAVAPRAALWPLGWWLVGNVCASLVGGRMYGHYFLLFVPALSVLGALGAVSWVEDRTQRAWLVGALALVCVGFFVAATVREEATGSFWSPKPDYRQVSAYVRERTRPDERIFVWGWFPAIYQAADRCPSTRFVYTHILSGAASTGSGHRVDEAWPMLMHDLALDPPPFVLDTSAGDYGYDEFPIGKFPALDAFVSARYRYVTELAGVRIYERKDRAAP